MKVLLTGGSGFIGRNLLESPLARKYEIIAPRHAELDLLDDCAVADFFKKNDISYVIHSACKPAHRNAKDLSGVFYANTRMFYNLAANSLRFKKMLFLGSGSTYDMRHYLPKMPETYFGTNIPADELGFSKYVCGKYIEGAGNIVDLRVFGIFGKYEDYSIRFISNMICKALFDLPLTIKQDRRFDYICIEDLPPILDYFLENNFEHKAYNITPDSSLPLSTVAEMVLKAAGKKLPVRVANPELGMEYSGDNARIKSELGRDFRLGNLEEQILNLYKWYLSRKSEINRDLLLQDK